MNGENRGQLNTLGQDTYFLTGSFRPNGTGAPLDLRGPKGLGWTVARTGVGLFVVTLGSDYNFPAPIIYSDCNATCDSLANWFQTCNIGDFNGTTRTLTLQCHRSGVAQEVAANVNARVTWSLYARNTTAA